MELLNNRFMCIEMSNDVVHAFSYFKPMVLKGVDGPTRPLYTHFLRGIFLSLYSLALTRMSFTNFPLPYDKRGAEVLEKLKTFFINVPVPKIVCNKTLKIEMAHLKSILKFPEVGSLYSLVSFVWAPRF